MNEYAGSFTDSHPGADPILGSDNERRWPWP